MTHPLLAVLGVLLASSLVTACSEDSGPPSDRGSGPDASSTASSSPTPRAGEVGSASCALSAKRLGFVVRDWGRVYDSIGREDHHRYTRALAAELAGVADSATRCHGAEAFARFRRDVTRIDAGSRQGSPRYALYDAAAEAGNAWLLEVGLGSNALSLA